MDARKSKQAFAPSRSVNPTGRLFLSTIRPHFVNKLDASPIAAFRQVRAREPAMIKIAVEGRSATALRQGLRNIDQRMAELLQEVGISLLSNIKLDFEQKSRGGTGAGGTKWAPLAPSTLKARERKGAKARAAKRAADKAKRAANPKPKKRKSILKRIGQAATRKLAKKARKLLGIKRKKKPKQPKKPASITSVQIGVDTGLLRNSANPGYQGPDGKGGNILEVTGHEVTVGYGRTYAPYFDGGGKGPARPLIPDPIPSPWQSEIDEIVNDWIVDVFGPVD